MAIDEGGKDDQFPQEAKVEGEASGPEQEASDAAVDAREIDGGAVSSEEAAEAVRQQEVERAEAIRQEIALSRAREREAADAAVRVASGRHTRRAFVLGGAAAAAGIGFYRWLGGEPADEAQPGLLRKTFETNAAIARGIDRDHVLTPTYPVSRAEILRVNGVYGLKMKLVPESWRLQVVGSRDDVRSPAYVKDVTAWEYEYADEKASEDEGHDTKVDPKMLTAAKMASDEQMQRAQDDENHTGRKPRGKEEAGESNSTLLPHTPGLLLRMEDVLQFPRHELVTQFKCIEGWSQIVQWAGVRLSDFLEAYPPAMIDGAEPKYVYMETPDGDYYNGYDLEACRHPQALLVTEMMGAPLTQFHGAPLRLHMPTKYGYKQIKRIGLISYTNNRPDDYWTKLGYDWYAGL